ncbi:alpha-hydroxy acid oxidase [Brytella acorum]|uniref:alpha-hydroxy acid oxidase n=1 Tax=Brytella acorum TaxID=2959299 RepID=UPI0025AE8BC8|nr:alpha-hydroxy acid oxidase [Brytella acorum]MDF3625495.1 alpha-hydroxy acid oxidase [Brytella acorum]
MSKRLTRPRPSSLRHALNLEDYERLVRRRLPRSVFGYVEGGADDGEACRHNREVFRSIRMIPKVLVDVSTRTQETTLFGQTYSAPFLVAPMGASSIVGYDADNSMARAARAARIPFVLSANSITPIEEMARTYPGAWFAAYQSPDARKIEDMCLRVADAGLSLYMLTVDVPVASNRENNVRTGYTMPFRMSKRLGFDVLRHPRWALGTMLRTMRHRGLPRISNVDPIARPSIFSRNIGAVTGHAGFSWRHAEQIRRCWKGPFVLKGILSPGDARLAREIGADGIVVSNHGGRQLDSAVSPVDVLQAIRAEAGTMTVLADSGFRRGTDILKGLALGADGILIGHPFLFAAALGGERAVTQAISRLKTEIDIDMALLGVNMPEDITEDMILRSAF